MRIKYDSEKDERISIYFDQDEIEYINNLKRVYISSQDIDNDNNLKELIKRKDMDEVIKAFYLKDIFPYFIDIHIEEEYIKFFENSYIYKIFRANESDEYHNEDHIVYPSISSMIGDHYLLEPHSSKDIGPSLGFHEMMAFIIEAKKRRLKWREYHAN